MICSVNTMSVNGIQGSLVNVECYISNGLPSFEVVGLPDAAVKEARERVRAAAKTSGMRFPNSRITVNLSPAFVKKSCTHFDLPILLSILGATGVLRKPNAHAVFIGEVGLDGVIRSVKGLLPMALAAKENEIDEMYVPAHNAPEATLARGPAIIPVHNVKELIASLNGDTQPIDPEPVWIPEYSELTLPDYKDVMGQHYAKRAMEIAAAGSHNVLMIGPPGSGKSMLAKRLPSILPDMTWNESLETSGIYSVLGLLTKDSPLVTHRPFRSPHHTISNAGLIGGGTNPKPGEISMAHKGVLFLDELPEFRRDTLDLMRQPLEDCQVTISRVASTLTYPAEFMLVCAMNPCKCGWYGDSTGRCTCSDTAVKQYRSRISGPLLDRIDMIIEVPAVKYDELRNRIETETSAEIKKRVNAARKIQNARFGENSGMCNSRMGPVELRKYCGLNEESHNMMQESFESYRLTARSYDRILRVARTIADLEGCEQIQVEHVAEAIQYRALNI